MTDQSEDFNSATRRALLQVGSMLATARASAGLLAGAGATAAVMAGTSTPARAQGANESVLDKWVRTKKAQLGFDFSTPAIQMRDPATNQPTGYVVDLVKLMMADLSPGIEIEYVEIPFAQLFAALAAGKCDMIQCCTNLPGRAMQGDFATIAAYYAPVYVLLKPGSTVQKPDDLNNENIRFSLLQGTSQLIVAQRMFPKAKFATFPVIADAINEMSSGRADASVQSAFSVTSALDRGAKFNLLATGPIYMEANTFLFKQADPRLSTWISNWMSYHAAIGTLTTLYNKWIGDSQRTKYKLQTVTVGPAGSPIVS